MLKVIGIAVLLAVMVYAFDFVAAMVVRMDDASMPWLLVLATLAVPLLVWLVITLRRVLK